MPFSHNWIEKWKMIGGLFIEYEKCEQGKNMTYQDFVCKWATFGCFLGFKKWLDKATNGPIIRLIQTQFEAPVTLNFAHRERGIYRISQIKSCFWIVYIWFLTLIREIWNSFLANKCWLVCYILVLSLVQCYFALGP